MGCRVRGWPEVTVRMQEAGGPGRTDLQAVMQGVARKSLGWMEMGGGGAEEGQHCPVWGPEWLRDTGAGLQSRRDPGQGSFCRPWLLVTQPGFCCWTSEGLLETSC